MTAPETSGIQLSRMNPSIQRGLVLSGKILTNLTNDVKFGSKEKLMFPCNSVLLKYNQSMHQYLVACSEMRPKSVPDLNQRDSAMSFQSATITKNISDSNGSADNLRHSSIGFRALAAEPHFSKEVSVSSESFLDPTLMKTKQKETKTVNQTILGNESPAAPSSLKKIHVGSRDTVDSSESALPTIPMRFSTSDSQPLNTSHEVSKDSIIPSISINNIFEDSQRKNGSTVSQDSQESVLESIPMNFKGSQTILKKDVSGSKESVLSSIVPIRGVFAESPLAKEFSADAGSSDPSQDSIRESGPTNVNFGAPLVAEPVTVSTDSLLRNTVTKKHNRFDDHISDKQSNSSLLEEIVPMRFEEATTANPADAAPHQGNDVVEQLVDTDKLQTQKSGQIENPKEQKGAFSFLKRPSLAATSGDQSEQSKSIFSFMSKASIQTEVSAAEMGEQPKGLFSFKKRPSIAAAFSSASSDEPEQPKGFFSFKKRGSISAVSAGPESPAPAEEQKSKFSFKKRSSLIPGIGGTDNKVESLNSSKKSPSSSGISSTTDGIEEHHKGRTLSIKRKSTSKRTSVDDESEENKTRFSFKRNLSISGPSHNEEEVKSKFLFKRNPSISGASHHEDSDESKGRFAFKSKRSSLSPPKKGAANLSLEPRAAAEELIDTDIMALWEIMGNSLVPLEKELLETSRTTEAVQQANARMAEIKLYLRQLTAPEDEIKESKPRNKRQSFFLSKQDAPVITEAT